MAATFHKVGGKSGSRTYELSGTVGINQIVQMDEAGTIAIHATNKSALGIALKAGVDNDRILVDLLYPESEVLIKGAGVTISAATVGDHVDVTAGAEITLTDTNKDAICVKWNGKSDGGIFAFKKTVYGSSTLS